MKAKKKELIVRPVAGLAVDVAPRLSIVEVADPPKRAAGVKLDSASKLVSRLQSEGVL
jgi:electron transfer flavoprotein beta subunit